MQVEDQPPGGLRVNRPGDDRLGQLADGALDGVRGFEADARPGVELPPLLLASPLGVQLRGMAVADGFALHGRSLALLAVAAKMLAAPVISVTGFRRLLDLKVVGLFG